MFLLYKLFISPVSLVSIHILSIGLPLRSLQAFSLALFRPPLVSANFSSLVFVNLLEMIAILIMASQNSLLIIDVIKNEKRHILS